MTWSLVPKFDSDLSTKRRIEDMKILIEDKSVNSIKLNEIKFMFDLKEVSISLLADINKEQ